MLKLIIGGAESGKSAYAQRLIETDHQSFQKSFQKSFQNGFRKKAVGSNELRGELIYLATMDLPKEPGALDRESLGRIERHVKMREGKGYRLIERPKDPGETVHMLSPDSFVLIEDITNLCANEMFLGDPDDMLQGTGLAGKTDDAKDTENRRSDTAAVEGKDAGSDNFYIDRLSEKIVSGIDMICKQCREAVAVTGELCSDGILYEKETVLYLKLLSRVNYELARRADYVAEIVCGLANVIKDETDGTC
ncbi:MAG: bifunctional adenosylcobinamide kinase/adenosylcobinamide-phosphate guanylyltransferase [Lachnospiraceae bacterium]|nr:bifunctional adenosylcobinamide kinase/adenosylcobinamide-phosphate guanylyltransferase [Lachnospiraceae bacterium]